jgi:hypothetical protein
MKLQHINSNISQHDNINMCCLDFKYRSTKEMDDIIYIYIWCLVLLYCINTCALYLDYILCIYVTQWFRISYDICYDPIIDSFSTTPYPMDSHPQTPFQPSQSRLKCLGIEKYLMLWQNKNTLWYSWKCKVKIIYIISLKKYL